MIHELLLALSGHSSPLFSEGTTPLAAQLSSAELALLKQLAQLGHLHQDIRVSAVQISESHDSIICRAIAASISNTQLFAFQQKILSIERDILSKDSSIVGAYDIVPLSGVAKAFTGWSRKLEWLKEACEHMRGGKVISRTGASMIDWLRAESMTGFSDLELVILDLITVAEKAWLRQLSTWIFYGRLSTVGGKDFLVQQGNGSEIFRVEQQLCPEFVTQVTARSILFIGRSLNALKNLDNTLSTTVGKRSILLDSANDISSLRHPIASTSLAQTIGKIRRSLAQNVLQNLLPLAEVVRFLNVLQEFFLISRREFSTALVGAADIHIHEQHLKDRRSNNPSRLADELIRDSDVIAVLRKAWANLVTFQNINDDGNDSQLELAREVFHLHIRKRAKAQEQNEIEVLHTMFDDALLGIAVQLSIQPSTRLSLFFTTEDNKTYSMIHAYLISLRKIHIHLTEIWKLKVLRQYQLGLSLSRINRSDASSIENSTERIWWAAVFSATFFVTELSAYLQEAITESWNTLQRWILDNSDGERDPEVIAAAHYVYLCALRESLLLNDTTFAKLLRKLIDNCNQVVALVQRLGTIRQALQAFHSETGSIEQLHPHLASENHETQQDLVLAAQAVDQSLKHLMAHLHGMDSMNSRLGFSASEGLERSSDFETSFLPWKGSGIRSLLLKLDLQATSNE